MSVIKKWSTGSIGNVYPDHSDRGNPNTKGLSYDVDNEIIGPGIEAYIEEDEVLASSDNRPLKNLVENDVILDKNISDVASEVDHGIFKDRYNEFSLDILTQDWHSDPEIPSTEFLTTPLRINSGSSIINGKVTRIGNQKILYFLRDDDSLLFPNYDESVFIELKDDNYFGGYRVVYTTISEDLPGNFESYEIKIVNKSTVDSSIEDRILVYKVFRDWEDIVPLKADSKVASNEVVNFQNDINFGQTSDGYWLKAPLYDGENNYIKDVPGTHATSVQIKKDIEIKDKFIEHDRLSTNPDTGEKEYEIITDGIFFNDVQWSISSDIFDSNADIQDIYIDKNDSIYFILRSTSQKFIYHKTNVSAQLQSKSLRNDGHSSINLGIKKIKDHLFVYGTNGFIRAFNLNQNFQESLYKILDIQTDEDIASVYEWNDQIWIAGETKVWHSNQKLSQVIMPEPTLENPSPTQDFSVIFTDWTFTELDLTSVIKDPAGNSIVKKITTLERTRGNIIIDTSINANIFNLAKNGSFEEGVPGQLPTNWNVYDDLNSGNSTFAMTASSGNSNTDRWGNYKGVINKFDAAPKATIYQDYLVEDNSRNRIFNFSVFLKSTAPQNSTIGIAEYDKYDQVITYSEEVWDITLEDINTWIRPELAFRISSNNTKYLRYYVNCSSNTPLQVDGAQLEEIDNTGIEITDITCGRDINGSLGSKYFLLNSPLHEYYIWVNVDTSNNGEGDSTDPALLETFEGSGVSLDPELADKTGVPVVIYENENAVEVAGKVANAINFLADFTAYRIQNTVKVQVNTNIPGDVVDAEEGTLGDHGFVINVAVQGLYQASQYVENYEYLFIGFEKSDTNRTDPPFALIDIKNPTGPDAIKYVFGKYGDIRKINVALHDDSNRMYIADDKRIYSLTFLNNYNSYDRFTMVDISKEGSELDVSSNIHRFESIAKFNDRILFGGTVDNRVIKAEYQLDNLDHEITFENINDGVEELLTLMGESILVHANGIEHAKREFIITKPLYEQPTGINSTAYGYYIPNKEYGFKVYVDGEFESDIIITSPKENSGPWTIQEIYEQIEIKYQGNKLNWLNPTGDQPIKPEWQLPESSSVKNDGFYSIGRQDLTRHIRGNVHKIFIPEGQTDKFYIIRGNQIFLSKFDPNVLKNENGNYPEELKTTGTVLTYDALPKSLESLDYGQIWHVKDRAYYQWLGDHWQEIEYYTKWKIYDEVNLTKYKHIDNIEKTFGDTSTNKVWVDLPIEPGYSLLKGSIRLKTNHVAEVGFTEGEDYFVDYDRNKIIRSDTINLLDNPAFALGNTVINTRGYVEKGDVATWNDLPTSAVNVKDVYYVQQNTQLDINTTMPKGYYVAVATTGDISDIWSHFENYYIPLNWNSQAVIGNDSAKIFKRIKDIYDNRNDIAEFIVSSNNPGDEVGVVYQTRDVDFAQDTYTFSVDLKAYSYSKVIIRISECNSTTANIFGYNKLSGAFEDSAYNSSSLVYEFGTQDDYSDISDFDVWKKLSISHELKNENTTKLRVEIYSLNSKQLRIDNAQLEKNASMTPFIDGSRSSRIDPNMHVWIDYVQYIDLTPGVNYTFNSEARKITFHEDVDPNEYFYFKYKYEKVFNPYDYGNSKPITTVNYDSRDDYFILKPEGRIWAINQMFAMLSLETENPLVVSYNYHYPRVDQVKIRNTPDRFGNFIYIVRGDSAHDNPYSPFDIGEGDGIRGSRQYFNGVEIYEIEDNKNNDLLYEINIIDNDYNRNDIYDRRIYIDARDNLNYNISLLPETLAYFPFKKDFNSTNGLTPLNTVKNSKIIPIIKNYSIIQNEEVGAWGDGYQIALRNEFTYPGTSFSVFVDPMAGSDSNDGKSENTAFKTVKKAVSSLYANSTEDYVTNIIITRPSTISENIEIDKGFTISIVAKTYCTWTGSIKNNSKLNLQGIWFKNTAIYPNSELNVYYCTFENSTMNCVSPQKISTYNTEFKNNHNSIIRVKNILYPSPFVHPYQRTTERDDGIANSPTSVATSDNESIAPGDEFINAILQSAPYVFKNCLIYGSTDHIIEFDPEPNWSSTFLFDFCTIADNKGLFSTPKYDLVVTYSNSIIYNNRYESKIFNSHSSINFDTCFIDFPNDPNTPEGDVSNWNHKSGNLLGRESCIYLPGESPQFIGEGDYHLKSVAKGSTSDSPALEQAIGGLDLGCYSETREQTEKDVPRKLMNYTAYLNEGLRYALTINSEKITVTMEFKPTGTVNNSGILFDTRTASDDLDYIVLAYNNNEENDHSLVQNPLNAIDNPYRFRVIVANQEKSYSIISPINITTDEEYQKWHRLSFTINYEKIINAKPQYDSYNKIQNIIIFYHNGMATIESFVKYDLSRLTTGELISGRGGEGTNAWDYNNITNYVTLGAAFDNTQNIAGYYDELRIDNRFIDRKQFELWNVKKVQFNDPISYVNQIPLTKSFDARTLQEYWSLKTHYDIGSKGNHFLPETNKRLTWEDGYTAWYIGSPTHNEIINSNFAGNHNALAETEYINYETPLVLESDWNIQTVESRKDSDNDGFNINILSPSLPFYNSDAGHQDLGLTISDTSISSGIGNNTFPLNININNTGVETLNFILDAPSGYQDLTFDSIITPNTETGLNPGDTEPEYFIEYTLYDDANLTGVVKSQSFKLEGVNEITSVITSGVSISSFLNKYFEISSVKDDHRYYVWFALDDGTGYPALSAQDPGGQENTVTISIDKDFPGGNNVPESQSWDGQGFTLYNNSNEPLNIWIDINHNTGSFGYTSTNLPDFSNTGSYISKSLDSGSQLVSSTTIASEIATLINGQSDFNAQAVGNVITITNTIKAPITNAPELHDTQAIFSASRIKLGLEPNTTLNAVNEGKEGIMVLVSASDTQDEISTSTTNAINNSTLTNGVLEANKIVGNKEITEITCVSNNIEDYDSKYFTIASTSNFGVDRDYYVWFDAEVAGVEQVMELTCVADNTASGDLNLMLLDKFFVLYTPTGDEHYFWYNVDGQGRDPGENHVAIQEQFTLSLNDHLNMDTMSYYASKYFTFSTPQTEYYVYFTVNEEGNDPLLPGKTGILVDINTSLTSSRTAVASLVVNILRAQVPEFSVASIQTGFATDGNETLRFFIPEGNTSQLPTIGNFDSVDMTITMIEEGKDAKVATYLGSGTGHEVEIVANDDANGVASRTALVVNGSPAFMATSSSEIVTITVDSFGPAQDIDVTNIIFTENTITYGSYPTRDPGTLDSSLSSYTSISINISSLTTRNEIAALISNVVNAYGSPSNPFTSTVIDNVVTLETIDYLNYIKSPQIGTLSDVISLNTVNDGNLPGVEIVNIQNGVVPTQPNPGTVNAFCIIEQVGSFASTDFAALIDKLNDITSGDLTWSIVDGNLRATTVAQGINSKVEITEVPTIPSGQENLIDSAGVITISGAVNGQVVDDTWSNIITLLNDVDSRIEWSIVDNGGSFDIRITSNLIGKGSSIIVSDSGDPNDLITKMGASHATLPENYLGFSNVTIHNQYDLEVLLRTAFEGIDTFTDWTIRNGKLVIYTHDFVATGIYVDFKQDGGTINSTAVISGLKEQNIWNINISDNTTLQNTVSYNYDREFNKHSQNSLLIQQNTVNTPIEINQNISLNTNTDYTFSLYVYYDNFILTEGIILKRNNDVFEWKSIEKLNGNWWKLTSSFFNQYPGNYNVGVSINNMDGLYVDSMQLEERKFVTPYLETFTDKFGRIGINKSIINPNTGTIFFKFKPYFKFDGPRFDTKKTIVQLFGLNPSNNEEDPALGLKVVYYFDPIKNRGIFEYRLNNQDSLSWKFETTKEFFNEWHSLGFVYDYNNNRFIYWFDYFKNILDTSMSPYTWSDLWIGQAGITGPSADMVVKDIVIQNYTTTDSEVQSWHTNNEFFNESTIYSNMDELRKEIEGVKKNGLDYSNISQDLENKIISLEGRINEYETNEVENASSVQKVADFIGYPQSLLEDYNLIPTSQGDHENRIKELETVTTTLDGKVTNLQDDLVQVINVDLRDVQENVNTLSTELNTESITRATQDQAIRSDISSTSINKGASLIGVHDTTTVFSATTVEGVLQEIAGVGRTTENLKTLGDEITNIQTILSNSSDDIGYIKDANTDRWSQALSQTNRYNVYDIRTDLNTAQEEIETIKDNQQYTSESYQIILIGLDNNSIDDICPLNINTSYSITLNGQEYYFTVPNNQITWNELFNDYFPQAINIVDSTLLQDSFRLDPSLRGNLVDIMIRDIVNTYDGFTISVLAGTTYNDLISAIGGLGEARAVGSLFDADSMNCATLSDRIYQEIFDREDSIVALRGEFASNLPGQGASLIGVEGGGLFITSTVEDVLQEIAGVGRNTSATIGGNYDSILSIQSDIAALQSSGSSSASEINDIYNTLGLMQDGIDGTTWDVLTTKPNLMDHETRISDNETNISNQSVLISVNANSIANLNTSVNTLNTSLSTETTSRINGDAYIMQQLADTASGRGASLISIHDADDRYTATTVEGALAEVDDKLAALAGALSWQSPVATFAELPTVGNNVGDARTVSDDGDGKQAQYVWTGTEWVKIADIDWGDASAIAYDGSVSEIPVTTVQAAIDYVYLNQKDKTKAEGTITNTDWVVGTGTYSDYYYATVNHGLETDNIVCLVMDGGIVIGVEDIERVDENNVRVYVVDNTLNLDVTVFGVVDKYSRVISQWTPDGQGNYYADVTHNFETNRLMVSAFDVDTQLGIGWLTGTESIEFSDNNTVRVKTGDNNTVINLFILKKASYTITKDIQNWIWDANKNAYVAALQVDASYDAVFNFFDPSNGKTVGVDMVQLENGILTIARSSNDLIRMIIIK